MELDFDLALTPSSVVVKARDFSTAKQLKKQVDRWATSALKSGRELVEIRWPGSDRQFDIPAFAKSSAVAESNEPSGTSDGLTGQFDQASKVLSLDCMKAMELMVQHEQEGKIVIITSMVTNLCKHTNNALKPSRGIRQPQEWTGYNYLKSWTLDDSEVPSEEYFDLIKFLRRDGYVPGYEYTLKRPDDGALVRYKTDYLLVKNWLGEDVRVGISRPEDFSVLSIPEKSAS